MAGPGFHVALIGSRGKRRLWGVEERGAVLCVSANKRLAVRCGRALAKEGRTSLRIHGRSGRILEESSYGNETKRPG